MINFKLFFLIYTNRFRHALGVRKSTQKIKIDKNENFKNVITLRRFNQLQ